MPKELKIKPLSAKFKKMFCLYHIENSKTLRINSVELDGSALFFTVCSYFFFFFFGSSSIINKYFTTSYLSMNDSEF